MNKFNVKFHLLDNPPRIVQIQVFGSDAKDSIASAIARHSAEIGQIQEVDPTFRKIEPGDCVIVTNQVYEGYFIIDNDMSPKQVSEQEFSLWFRGMIDNPVRLEGVERGFQAIINAQVA